MHVLTLSVPNICSVNLTSLTLCPYRAACGPTGAAQRNSINHHVRQKKGKTHVHHRFEFRIAYFCTEGKNCGLISRKNLLEHSFLNFSYLSRTFCSFQYILEIIYAKCWDTTCAPRAAHNLEQLTRSNALDKTKLTIHTILPTASNLSITGFARTKNFYMHHESHVAMLLFSL